MHALKHLDARGGEMASCWHTGGRVRWFAKPAARILTGYGIMRLIAKFLQAAWSRFSPSPALCHPVRQGGGAAGGTQGMQGLAGGGLHNYPNGYQPALVQVYTPGVSVGLR